MFDIVDFLVKNKWLYNNVFWDELLNKIAYNQEREEKKVLLKVVFWFNDIDEIFDKELKRDKFNEMSRILFKISENGNSKK